MSSSLGMLPARGIFGFRDFVGQLTGGGAAGQPIELLKNPLRSGVVPGQVDSGRAALRDGKRRCA
jgi:hypothetical protein